MIERPHFLSILVVCCGAAYLGLKPFSWIGLALMFGWAIIWLFLCGFDEVDWEEE